MNDESAPIVAHVPNSGIVHMPGRRFPGIVVMGDSLSSMFDKLADALIGAKKYKDEESYYSILIVAEKMQELLSAYEQALSATGTKLPYSTPIAERFIHDNFLDT